MIDAAFDDALRDALVRCVGAGTTPGRLELRRLKAIVRVAIDDAADRYGGQASDGDAAKLARRVALRHVVQAVDAGVRIRLDVDPRARPPVVNQDGLESLLDHLVLRAVGRAQVSQVLIRAAAPKPDDGECNVVWSVIDDGVVGGSSAELEDCEALARQIGAELCIDSSDGDGTTVALTLRPQTG